MHLALAPKSNASYMGLDRALDDVRNKPVGEVPKHLRDASYRASARLGHGKGYRYPHDDAQGWVAQQYLPDELADAVVLPAVGARRRGPTGRPAGGERPGRAGGRRRDPAGRPTGGEMGRHERRRPAHGPVCRR